MNSFAITLVLFSTFMHAGWNLLSRHRRLEGAFFQRMLLLISVAGFFPAIISEMLTHSLTAKAWICVLFSGVSCGLYFFSLSRAYRASDFVIVYPVARALPVLLVGIGDVFRGRYPTSFGWLGMILVMLGCFLIPLESIRDFEWKRYFNKTSLWMILTAAGTVSYSLLDKVAAESVSESPFTALRYGYIFFLISYVVYLVAFRLVKQEGSDLSDLGWKYPAIAAFLNFASYGLVLWAYQLSERASYVVAFRQFSIVIGVIGAFIIYKERGVVVRLTAVSLITIGLVSISLWGK